MVFKLFAKCSDEEMGGIFNQVLMTILINLPLISFGMTMGWLSPNTQLLQSPSQAAPLSDQAVSWMAAVSFLAAVPAVFLFWYAVDMLGRKPALICTSVPFAICWAMKLSSTEPWVLISARAIAGLGSSGCFIVAPLYIKEISQDSIRGALGSVVVLAQNLGYLVVYIMSDFLEYRTVLWGCLGLSVAHVLVFALLPESPAFLVSRNRIEEASQAMAWLRRRSPRDKLVLEAVSGLQQLERLAESSKKESFRSIVGDKTTFRAFRIALVVVLAQEVCGLFTLLMFAGRIFTSAGAVSLTPNQQTIILGAVQLGGSVLAALTVERLGRKPLLAATGYIISLCMLTLGLWFYMTSQGHDLPPWIPMVAMCLGIFCDSAGLQPVPFVIMSELFRFELRGMVTAVIMGVTDLANFTELKVFHPMVHSMGIHTCFWMFTVISFCFATYTVVFVPETMGKTVEEIFEDLKGRGKRKDLEGNRGRNSSDFDVKSENNNLQEVDLFQGKDDKYSNDMALDRVNEDCVFTEKYSQIWDDKFFCKENAPSNKTLKILEENAPSNKTLKILEGTESVNTTDSYNVSSNL